MPLQTIKNLDGPYELKLRTVLRFYCLDVLNILWVYKAGKCTHVSTRVSMNTNPEQYNIHYMVPQTAVACSLSAALTIFLCYCRGINTLLPRSVLLLLDKCLCHVIRGVLNIWGTNNHDKVAWHEKISSLF